MDVFGIGFLVVISLVGGLIAIFADNLGRTLGKKRLSVKTKRFSVRPRRFAQIVTFGAGAAIPILTILVVMWLSADVRQWFAEGPGLIKQRDDLTQEVSARRDELQKLGVLNEQIKGDLESTTQQVAKLTQREKDLQTKVSGFEAQVIGLNARAQELMRKTSELTRKASELTEQIARKTKDVNLLTQKNQSLEVENNQLEDSFNRVSADISASYDENIRIQNENSGLLKQNEKLVKDISGLETRVALLSDEFESKRKELEKNLTDKQRELELTAIELDQKRGELQRADLQLQQVGEIAFASRRLPMMYRMGEEITRIQVGANLNRNQALDQLTRLIRISRTEAETRGAKGRGTYPSAGIMDRLDPDTEQIIPADDQLERIVRRIGGVSEELVLVSTSTVNSFLGEPVSLDIQFFRNPIVFTRGELVAESRVEGDRPEENVVAEISDFVRNDVKKRAQEEGMVPILGMEHGYGELTQDTLLALMRTAKANNRRVRIQAIAPKDIRAGDPLILDYRIR